MDELKQITKMRHIRDYKSMSGGRLLSVLDESEQIFINARIKKIWEDLNRLRDRFLKPKIKEIRRNLYEIENENNLSESNIEEINQNLTELEKSLSSIKKYCDCDDAEYKGITDIGNLFDEFDEDYYKPIKTKSYFSNIYIEYESKGDKDKNLSLEEYLDMIRPY